jgi:hypothetical protein
LSVRVAWLCLLAGCLPELDNAVVVRGRHVNVYADPAIPVCKRAIAIADRYVEDTAALLAIPPPSVDYFLFDGPTNCASGDYTNVSCVIGGDVFANAWVHFHELAHAVDDSFPPALFAEGFAEALSIPSNAARSIGVTRATARLELESTAFRAGDPLTNYRVAGDFVRYLLERFGVIRYRAFARSLLSLSDEITIRRAFERAYRVSLEQVIADWRATDPASSTLVIPADVVECHDPVPPVGFETWGDDDVEPDECTSGVSEHGTVYAQQSRRYGFEVNAPGLFQIQVEGAGAGRGEVRSCVDGAIHGYDMATSATRFTTLPLRAGRHAIQLVEGARSWRIGRLGGMGETCEDAPTFTAPARDTWQLEFRGHSETWLRIAQPGARELVVAATAPVDVCVGACGDLQCQRITSPSPVSPEAGPLYIRIVAAAPDLKSVFVTSVDDSSR